MIDATASTSTASAAIRDFAAAVREQLSDLPADDIDDLTDGLEADLTEQAADAAAADGGTENAAPTSPERGDPVAYAAKPRSAAYLPPRREPVADAHGEPLASPTPAAPAPARPRIRCRHPNLRHPVPTRRSRHPKRPGNPVTASRAAREPPQSRSRRRQ